MSGPGNAQPQASTCGICGCALSPRAQLAHDIVKLTRSTYEAVAAASTKEECARYFCEEVMPRFLSVASHVGGFCVMCEAASRAVAASEKGGPS